MSSNLVALTTGSTRGLGFETATQLARRGVTSILSGRAQSDIDSKKRLLRDRGIEVETVLLDITDDDSVSSAVADITQRFGRLDILINNAGVRIEEYGKFPSDQPLEAWFDTFRTNLFGTVRITNALLPLLRLSPRGRIVNVSSLLGSVSTHGDRSSYIYDDEFKSLPAYSASKSALNSWTVHLAYELRETGIEVNSVHPGYSITDMNDGKGLFEARDGARTAVETALSEDSVGSGRFLHMAEEIAW
ncbi:SDR family NAD(P)-dependent oxidoreductase [Mycobacterium sp. BMJ-28]